MPTITTDEWLKELESLGAFTDSEGQTTIEICEASGHGDEWVRRHLRKLADLGRLKVGQRHIVNLSGSRQTVPVYSILPDPRLKDRASKRNSVGGR